MKGYHGYILDVNLTTSEIKKTAISETDLKNFIGGRGLGAKLIWDRIKRPGTDPFSPENVIAFMSGPFSGLPIPNSSRTCIITKSPHTSAQKSQHKNASTITYTNMGGFFGPELRFAGYEGILISGRSEKPVYLFIENDKAELRDAAKFWGMGTDEFDRKFIEELGERRFQSCYIGPAGEKMVPYASVINTAARASGRGGAGCVMGSKNLKAIAVRGTGMPEVANHKKFIELLEKARQSFAVENQERTDWRTGGTANALEASSKRGSMAVKNYSEGSFPEIQKIGTGSARKEVWKRDFACYCCQLSCKKSGMAKGAYGGMVHDGPEYETGTMLGANLLISDLNGLNKCIAIADDYGIDIISVGNVIGFLMEAYDRKLIDQNFLEGTELKWGNVDATIQLLHKIGKKDPGLGELAASGVKKLAEVIGKESYKFAIHVKGQELAAWNVHVSPSRFGISYATANRGACHMNGGSPDRQNKALLRDSLGMCSFADSWYKDDIAYHHFLSAITGLDWSEAEINKASERGYNLEKMFNVREGFGKADDTLPERFFIDKPTYGPAEGKLVDKAEFEKSMQQYYESRGWDSSTSIPKKEKLAELDLLYTI